MQDTLKDISEMDERELRSAEADSDLRLRLAMNLQDYMCLADKTRADVSRETGISKSAINNYLHGIRWPQPKQLKLLAQCLGVTVGDLTDDFIGDDSDTRRNGLSDTGYSVGRIFDELDGYGQRTVRAVLDMELERVRNSRTD